jgi:23S rRNA (cytidine1920-2'-O)/16S rRNA (cytidine1409-2'-O)-methyltransferase
LPIVKKIVADRGKVLAMIKPQFELSPQEIKKGVVRDEVLRMKAIEKIRACAVDLGFEVIGSADSAVKGPKGNLEHFLYLSIA